MGISRLGRAFAEETLVDILKKRSLRLLCRKPEEARTPGMGDGREEELGLTLTDERRSFMSTRSH